ncbi:DUF1365 domain-containing protein [Haematobacter genomosp. 1]|uniref:Cyclopropane-fatty-acyl-phospholipid synthase n=1 Tax=Haematobacter genomosp. 1 TaxID=366618 RepID=A0A212ADT7_9RHOB|nr:DUF1365 domain-containing protein [Haematobacter genomosp. 1]OWJ79390.1 cyclopropane-fatty-acyl-phospholipid synthase [Haematobacter genomosp. 1]
MEPLADRLLSGEVLHLRAGVTHARRGVTRHAFAYRVDYVLMAPETMAGPRLLSHNGFNLMAFHDRDHGGPRGAGRGAPWAWEQLAAAGIDRRPGMVLALLTQPRFLGHWFTPVSFWLLLRGNDLLAAIAEVNNTFGQRHSYLCLPLGASISPDDEIRAAKAFHVSPFQDVAGEYRFRFGGLPDRLAIRIRQIDGAEGLEAAMAGPLSPLTNRAVMWAALHRPGGGLRVLALIYWHALRLKRKGARYRPPPSAPEKEISR